MTRFKMSFQKNMIGVIWGIKMANLMREKDWTYGT